MGPLHHFLGWEWPKGDTVRLWERDYEALEKLCNKTQVGSSTSPGHVTPPRGSGTLIGQLFIAWVPCTQHCSRCWGHEVKEAHSSPMHWRAR